MSDEARLQSIGDRIRGLLYSWTYSESGPNELLKTSALMENGPSTFRLDSPASSLTPHALAIGTSPSISLLASYIISLYVSANSVQEFITMASIANLSYYGISLDASSVGILRVLSLATRNTLTICQHFADEPTLHEFLRLINYDIDHIPADHPFAPTAVCYWALRQMDREYTRWDVDRKTPFPTTRLYIERTVNSLSRFDECVSRTVFTILCSWFGVDCMGDVDPTTRQTIEYHVLWHRVCVVNCI